MDITKIRSELGWQPRHSLADGLRQTVEWYLDAPGLDGSRPPAAGLPRLDGDRITRTGRRRIMKGIILAGGTGHAPAPADPAGQQATAAGVRQADDLLPALDADAGGHPRDPGHQHARGPARSSAACWATARSGAFRSPTPSRPSRAAWRMPSASARTSSTATGLPDPGRQHLLRHGPAREDPQRGRPARRAR